jgi:hypothetical protein
LAAIFKVLGVTEVAEDGKGVVVAALKVYLPFNA